MLNYLKRLKENEAMVLRMGGGQKTNFVLLFKTNSNLKNFFLDDEGIFSNLEPRTFMPKVEMRKNSLLLNANKIRDHICKFCAINRGKFHKSLGLDGNTKITMPATGKSTITFDVKVHSSINHIFHHKSGQVEIDGIFLGQKKNGEDCLFVLEAKNTDSNTTLSKHKLVYPILSIGNSVPLDIKIVLNKKSIEHKDIFEFKIAECFYEMIHLQRSKELMS